MTYVTFCLDCAGIHDADDGKAESKAWAWRPGSAPTAQGRSGD
jgi:hypothetical protein